MEDDISIEIAEDEARKETKTEEPSSLRYQRDLCCPKPTWAVAVNSESLILQADYCSVACSDEHRTGG
jgi:hypothetical protein